MSRLPFFIFTCTVLVLSAGLSAAPRDTYANGQPFAEKTPIDRIMMKTWNQRGISPAGMCSDSAFVRRLYIDLTGTLPTLEQTRSFLADPSPDKREKLIDQLLDSDNFPLYFSLKWCDILRVKSEFPIKMWPNAVQAYHHWVWMALRENMPYDQFARELLTTSGSNFRAPPVNFYRGTQERNPQGFAKIAALTFLGSRIETWPESERSEFEKFFTRVAIKGTSEWKEQIVYLDPAPVASTAARLPDGTRIKLNSATDPREKFAAWLTSPNNLWFAEAAVNRAWFWLFGRGIIEEPDDFRIVKKKPGAFHASFWDHSAYTNMGNPPVSQALLDYLAKSFIQSGYDFKKLCRIIVSSSVYQQSCVPAADKKIAAAALAVYPVHRLDAEVLIDTFTEWGNLPTKYVSMIPEPFTFIPSSQRTIALADGSISSAFLETFGRPSRDTGHLRERDNQVTYSQRLYLLNSPQIVWKVSNSPFLKKLLTRSKGHPDKVIDDIYLTVLSREPTPGERESVKQLLPNLKSSGSSRHKKNDWQHHIKALYGSGSQLIWTLINTEEFLFQH